MQKSKDNSWLIFLKRKCDNLNLKLKQHETILTSKWKQREIFLKKKLIFMSKTLNEFKAWLLDLIKRRDRIKMNWEEQKKNLEKQWNFWPNKRRFIKDNFLQHEQVLLQMLAQQFWEKTFCSLDWRRIIWWLL